MKKLLFLSLFAAVVCCGCTSKEQDEKIHAFWGEQMFKLMSNPTFSQVMMKSMMRGPAALGGMGAMGAGQPAFNEADLQAALQALNALSAEGFGQAQQQPAVPAQPAAAQPTPAQSAKKAVMQQILDSVKESNKRTMASYSFLPADKQKQVRAIMNQTERDLQQLMNRTNDTNAFILAQDQALSAQNDRIVELLMEDAEADFQ